MSKYRIFHDAMNDQYYVATRNAGGFWQQVSPYYVYEHSAIKWVGQREDAEACGVAQ